MDRRVLRVEESLTAHPWEGPPGVAAGVGSRETPPDVCDLMMRVALYFRCRGSAWRSGGQKRGADEAIRQGAAVLYSEVPPFTPIRLELYLPHRRFGGHVGPTVKLAWPSPNAYHIGRKHHPAWHQIHGVSLDLLARTSHVILGPDLRSPPQYTPVRWVLCWTPDGATTAAETSRRTGGTGQAIRIASAFGIPVYNLARSNHRALLEEVIR